MFLGDIAVGMNDENKINETVTPVEVETFTKVYEVYQPRMEGLRDSIAKLNRRAVKIGVAPIVVRETGNVRDEEIKNPETNEVTSVRRFVEITVTGTAPKFNGWTLAAVIERVEDANLIRKSPDCKIELAKYRDCLAVCDHCKTDRNRNSTYVVAHDSGELKQVGSSCIKDFLGHKDPHALAALAEIAYSLGELCEEAGDGDYSEGGGVRNLLLVKTFLNHAQMAVRTFGFVSSKRAKEDMMSMSTAMTAMDTMFPPRNGRTRSSPTDEDRAQAEKAVQHVLDTLGSRPSESLNDFEHNILTVCKCSAVDPKNAGLLAFVPEYYRRSIEERKVAAESKHFGEVGKRARDVKITYLKSTGFDSQYGYTFIHSFAADDGSKLIWKTGSNFELNSGESVVATFTVKSHDEYKGHKQTHISRVKLSDKNT